MFKRRTKRSTLQILTESVYPRGGWKRATLYVIHRLRRLPDPAHRISRGIFAGVFVIFTPLYGFHFVAAVVLAWMIGGNVLAALLATFAGNPITFPFIAALSVELGSWMLGRPAPPISEVFDDFKNASVELWSNLIAIFTPDRADWSHFADFWGNVFLPYLVGGLIPGLVAGLVAYWIANPVIASYQRGRIHRLKDRFEKRRLAAEAAREARLETLDAARDETADARRDPE